MKISKYILMILLSSFIGIMANPEVLMASDSLKLAGVDYSNAVETVIINKPVEIAPVNVISSNVAVPATGNNNLATVSAPSVNVSAKAPAALEVVQAVSSSYTSNVTIKVAGKTLYVEDAHVAKPAYDHVYRQIAGNGTTWIYGHNTAELLRGVYYLKSGDTFSITDNGVTTTYRVAATRIFGMNGGYLTLNGNRYNQSKIREGWVSWNDGSEKAGGLDNNKKAYDAVIQTCYGTDDSERFVVFANKI